MTSALDVVPFGVETSIVWSHSGAPFGHALLEERLPERTVREPLQHRGPTSRRAEDRLGDGEVVMDEIQLGRTETREEDLVGVRDLHAAARHLDGLTGGSAIWARHVGNLTGHSSSHVYGQRLAGSPDGERAS